MKTLKRADTFGEDDWQVDFNTIKEIKEKVAYLNAVDVEEEDIDYICMALVDLGYLKI